MIKDENQYHITKKRRDEFVETVKQLRLQSLDVHPLLRKAQIDSLESWIETFDAEIAEWQKTHFDWRELSGPALHNYARARAGREPQDAQLLLESALLTLPLDRSSDTAFVLEGPAYAGDGIVFYASVLCRVTGEKSAVNFEVYPEDAVIRAWLDWTDKHPLDSSEHPL